MNRFLFAAMFALLGGAVVVATPAPTASQLDPKQVAELKIRLEQLAADLQKAMADAMKADEEAKVAADELAKLVEAGRLGKISATALEQLKTKAAETKAKAEASKSKVKELESAIAQLKAKLKGPVPPPAPTAPQVDPKVVAELKAKLAKLTDEVAKVAGASKKADAEAKVAADELAEIRRVAMLGRVRAGTIEAAEAKAKAAEAAADAARKQVKVLEATIADLNAKLKEIEK